MKRLENEFSGKWRALIGRFRKFGREPDSDWLFMHGAIFSSFPNNDETLKREKLFELEFTSKKVFFVYF